MVLQARGEAPEAKLALGELCENYWMPVFRFLRREGREEDESRELAQEFFARLLSRNSLDHVDPRKGRFRSYLLGALKHFLLEERRNAARQKRGGDAMVESIDSGGTATSPGMALEDPKASVEDTYFDREWAVAVMDRGLTVVRERFEASGKATHFEVLKPWLMGAGDGAESGGLSQSEAAESLGLSPGAVKVAIHRLRKNFRDAIQQEIAETVTDPSEVREELRYLIEVLS